MPGRENYPQDSRGPQDAPRVTNIRDIMAAAFRSTPQDRIGSQDPADEARLLTTVYTELGLFNPAFAEQVPEILKPRIADLRAAHPGTELQPLVAVRLVPDFGLRALLANFNKRQTEETFVWPGLWPRYESDLPMLNRRSLDGNNDPADLAVVGMPLAADNTYGEAGLTLTDRTLEQQRRAIGRGMLANVVDWTVLAALGRERGERPIDSRTFTRFPQMQEYPVDGVDGVGAARSLGSQAALGGSGGGRYGSVGVRRLVGRDKS